MTLFFYIFASLIVLGSIGVVASRNSVHSVLWLIFVFCNASGLFILLGAEFLAMTLVIVYVGAVAVLFLFVVMMLGNRFLGIQGILSSTRHLIIAGLILGVLLFDLVLVILAGADSDIIGFGFANTNTSITNTHAIGAVLYTDFMLPFQLSGIVLFVAMIGCIVLTLDNKVTRKRQKPQDQLSRSKESGMDLVQAPLNEGIDGIKYD